MRGWLRWAHGLQPDSELDGAWRCLAGLLSVRSAVPGWQGPDRFAADRAERKSGEIACGGAAVDPLQRSPGQAWTGLPQSGLRAPTRRDRLQAREQPV